MQIGVLEIGQQANERPRRFVSKNAAKCLTRRLVARRISKFLIQMVAVRSLTTLPHQIPLPQRPYIPADLPASELPGLLFTPPNLQGQMTELSRRLLIRMARQFAEAQNVRS